MKTHENDEDEERRACDECQVFDVHKLNAEKSRQMYKMDNAKEANAEDVYFSVDMQKVIMLPRLPGVKTCVFTRRLVLFHEIFAPLGGNRRGKAVGVVWNEAVRGRNAEDVASSYVKAMKLPKYRDYKNFVFWTDNCGAQNKNWIIFTAMVGEVNQPGGPESIAFKYLEKGHTFMSADAFHAQVEKGMRKKKNVCDLDDFIKIVDSKGSAIEMTYLDFYQFENGASSAKFTDKPKLRTVCSCMFKKRSSKIFWKTSFDDPEYRSGEFLKKKVAASLLRGVPTPAQGGPRGISVSKKQDIIDKLCPLMPSNRSSFWHNLHTDENVSDLIDNQ